MISGVRGRPDGRNGAIDPQVVEVSSAQGDLGGMGMRGNSRLVAVRMAAAMSAEGALRIREELLGPGCSERSVGVLATGVWVGR